MKDNIKKVQVECANCRKKEGLKTVHLEIREADLYLPYCPNCHGDEKKWINLIKKQLFVETF